MLDLIKLLQECFNLFVTKIQLLSSSPPRHSLVSLQNAVLPFILFSNVASFLCPFLGSLHSVPSLAQAPWLQQYLEVFLRMR